MGKYRQLLATIITIGGSLLLLLDLVSLSIHMPGADSISGAILLGCGILALQQKEK